MTDPRKICALVRSCRSPVDSPTRRGGDARDGVWSARGCRAPGGRGPGDRELVAAGTGGPCSCCPWCTQEVAGTILVMGGFRWAEKVTPGRSSRCRPPLSTPGSRRASPAAGDASGAPALGDRPNGTGLSGSARGHFGRSPPVRGPLSSSGQGVLARDLWGAVGFGCPGYDGMSGCLAGATRLARPATCGSRYPSRVRYVHSGSSVRFGGSSAGWWNGVLPADLPLAPACPQWTFLFALGERWAPVRAEASPRETHCSQGKWRERFGGLSGGSRCRRGAGSRSEAGSDADGLLSNRRSGAPLWRRRP
ncbi:hypothetical protein SAMN05444320_105390 [Streptoalloteichus hindustanus]|uniref:Uncharacterized protein n=1 Tax=Streptoalloteichus hindustanus TaxID=2017 RepID=A0A1M5FEN4_STRHI|nr:hypothetical protein SAMN05444320_105390 [Streptoalloteichus hindustanus]